MGAIFGIYGEADNDELQQLSARLAHRGNTSAIWSVNDRMHFGVRSRGGIGNQASTPDVPVAYDGYIDIEEGSRLKQDGVKNNAGDIHTIFRLYRKMGPDGLRLLRDPFALALWDERDESLFLATDSLGIKTIYYTSDVVGRFIFASEYKALLGLNTVPAEMDLNALQYVHRTKYAMPGHCCLSKVTPVQRGGWFRISNNTRNAGHYQNVKVDIASRTEAGHIKALQNSLLNATSRLIHRNEHVGIALSGGVDSVAVVAAARRAAPDKIIHSFTTGINRDDQTLVEARKVAEYFNTEHHESIFEPTQLPVLMRNALWHMEEPTGRDERVMYHITAANAAKHVSLILTGHNADTIYGGMPRHLIANLAFTFPIFRKPIADFYNYTQLGEIPKSFLGNLMIKGYFKGKAKPGANVSGAHWSPELSDLSRNTNQPLNEYLRKGEFYGASNTYATEKIFGGVEVDIISPFWDIDFIEGAFQIPDRLKIKGLKQKYILKQSLTEMLPGHLLNRKKDFIRIMQDISFCDCLQKMADEILCDDAVNERGLFELNYCRHVRHRPRNGFYSMQQFYNLWSLLLIEFWCRIFIDNRGRLDAEVL